MVNHVKKGALVLLSIVLASAACDKKDKKATDTASVEMASVDPRDVFSDPAVAELADAAAKGDTARVNQAIKAGANPSAVGDKKTSVLQWSMLNKSKAGFTALLTAGADTTHTDEAGDTIVHYAAKANDPEYLDILLAHKVDLNKPNSVTWATPLMGALMGERKEQFRKLLAAGANPNQADRVGNTSLHVAAKINENQLVLELLQAGADPAAKNNQGGTFQRYLNMTPTNILSEDARRQRENVMASLRAHNVPLENTAAAPR